MAQYRRDTFRLIEATMVGLFFVQVVRFLYGTLYAHLSSASLVALTADVASLNGQPGVVNPAEVELELLIVGAALFAPLLSILLGRLWFSPALAAIVVAAGRVFMTANGGTLLGVTGAAATAGAAALYFTLIAVRRPAVAPAGMVFGFAADQLIRLYGSTSDVTWQASFLEAQTLISLGLFLVAVLTIIFERVAQDESASSTRGEINGWSAFALGGLLYLQFAVLGLPNTVAHRAGIDYIAVAPWLVGATLLPLVPEVRHFARRFLGMFDGQYRGWVWFLMISLLLVMGFRFDGMAAASMLIAAQFMISLSFWWVVQPSDGRRNFTGLGMVFGILFFVLLTGADFFTYDYAFVRGVQEPLASILRAFRDMGLVVALLAVLLVCLPAILARKRLPWYGGHIAESLAALVIVIVGAVLAASLARPVVMIPPVGASTLRVATLNLHGGYGLYFNADLPELANQIRQNGVDVLLLQEVETGRLVSFGIDQPAWLARTLNMQVSYFPTTEGMQGLAVISRLPIEREDGLLLTSQSKQTGVQFVRVRKQNDEPMDVYNTQLSLLFRGGVLSIQAQEQDQNRQLLEIFDYLLANDSAENRLIVGGTFNQGPGSEIYTFMVQQGFIDPFADFPAERAVTLRLVNQPSVRVDYLWLRRIDPRFVGVTPIAQSSHNLAIVEISLEETAD